MKHLYVTLWDISYLSNSYQDSIYLSMVYSYYKKYISFIHTQVLKFPLFQTSLFSLFNPPLWCFFLPYSSYFNSCGCFPTPGTEHLSSGLCRSLVVSVGRQFINPHIFTHPVNRDTDYFHSRISFQRQSILDSKQPWNMETVCPSRSNSMCTYYAE